MASQVSVTLRVVDQFTQKMDQMAEASERAQGKIVNFGEASNAAMDKVTTSANRVSSSMEQAAGKTDDISGSSARAQEAFEAQASTADKCAEEVNKYGEEVEDATDKSEDFGEKGSQSAMDLGNALVAAGIVMALHAIAEAYNECDAAADEFEVSMAKVSTIADETSVSLGQMKSSILDLSSKTGVAASDLSEAAYGAISASVDTANAVQFVEQANALAVGGFTQQATAVDVLTTAINAYEMETEEASHVADVLITTQNLGKTTVNELASSMGMLIPTAEAYNVSLENLTTSYALMTANGINTANATTYLNRVLVELADSGSDVAGILVEQTGKSFAELMDEGNSLGDVMEILGDSVDGDTVAFSNLWGSSVAGRGALSLLNAGAEKFNGTMEEMEDSAGAADKAFEKMAGTGEFVEKRWTNAINNLKIAIGDAQPSMDSLMSAGTDIVESLTAFVQENPAVVKAISAIAVGLGTMALSLVGVTAAIKAADVVTKIWNTTLNANPIFLIISAIAGFTAAVIALQVAMSDTVPAEERLIGTSQKLQDKIDEQKDVVADAEEKWGQFDDRTIEAKKVLKDLEDEFESTGMTIGELMEKVEEQTNAFRESAKAHQENLRAIDDETEGSLILLSKLQDLERASNKTTEQKELEKNIIDQLKDVYPELAENYNEVTGKIEMSTAALKEYVKQKAEEKKYQADIERYTDLLIERAEAEKTVDEAVASVSATQEERERAWWQYVQAVSSGNIMLVLDTYETVKAFDEQVIAAQDAQAALKDIGEELDNLGAQYGLTEDAITQTAEATDSMISTTEGLKEAMNGVFAGVEEDAQALIQAYNEAKQAAREAIDSSFGLFDTLTTETTYKADEMIAALESQAEYLKNYNDNIQTAKDLGLDESLLEHLADGSTESAEQLQAIIDKVNEFGDNKDKAQEFVDSMNKSFEGVETAKNKLAETMTQMNKDLQQGMDDLDEKMKKGVEGLNLSSEAATAATATMTAYLTNIQTLGDEAVTYAQSVGQRVMSALSGAGSLGTAGAAYEKIQTPKHAAGSTFGENVYIAGEHGPELIVGRQGSEVFPASETAKILQAIMSRRDSAPAYAPLEESSQTITQNTNTNRSVTINVNGKGAISIPRGVSRDDIMSIMRESIEAEIEDVIRREILEEGDTDYVF